MRNKGHSLVFTPCTVLAQKNLLSQAFLLPQTSAWGLFNLKQANYFLLSISTFAGAEGLLRLRTGLGLPLIAASSSAL